MPRDSKYDPLRDFLITRQQRELSLTLEEIEDVLGFALPKSSGAPQWWANIRGSTHHTQFRAWRDAGFDAFLTAGRDAVRFVRTDRPESDQDAARRGSASR